MHSRPLARRFLRPLCYAKDEPCVHRGGEAVLLCNHQRPGVRDQQTNFFVQGALDPDKQSVSGQKFGWRVTQQYAAEDDMRADVAVSDVVCIRHDIRNEVGIRLHMNQLKHAINRGNNEVPETDGSASRVRGPHRRVATAVL